MKTFVLLFVVASVLLVMSLAFNLLIAGAVAASIWRFRHGPPPARPMQTPS